MTEQQLELDLQVLGKTAPRITPADIEANIDTVYYFTAGDAVRAVLEREGLAHFGYHNSLDLLTFCTIVLKNGFTVTGESACASPSNFDAGIGQKLARADAVNKVWPLMGYELKQRLYEQRAK